MVKSYNAQLKILQSRRRRVSDLYEADIRNAAHENKSSRDIYLIRDNQHWELRDFDGQIAALQTMHLLELAEHYSIPTGHLAWEEDDKFGHRHLTIAATAQLRDDIRAERKERWEQKARWLPVLGAITGVLGAAIGVLSFLYKH